MAETKLIEELWINDLGLVGYETFLLGSALRQHICGSGRRVVSAAVGRVRMHCRRTARADAALGLGWIRAPDRKSYATVIIGGAKIGETIRLDLG